VKRPAKKIDTEESTLIHQDDHSFTKKTKEKEREKEREKEKEKEKEREKEREKEKEKEKEKEVKAEEKKKAEVVEEEKDGVYIGFPSDRTHKFPVEVPFPFPFLYLLLLPFAFALFSLFVLIASSCNSVGSLLLHAFNWRYYNVLMNWYWNFTPFVFVDSLIPYCLPSPLASISLSSFGYFQTIFYSILFDQNLHLLGLHVIIIIGCYVM